MPWKNDIVIFILNVMAVNKNLIWRKNSLSSIWNHFVRNALISSHQNSKNELRKIIQRNSKNILKFLKQKKRFQKFAQGTTLKFFVKSSNIPLLYIMYALFLNNQSETIFIHWKYSNWRTQPIRVQSTVNKACFPNNFMVF